MTISSTLNRTSQDGNGTTTTIPVSFPFHSGADLVVLSVVIATGVQTLQTIITHYTITGTPDALGHYSNGGAVEMVTAPASTIRTVVYRDPPRTQALDLVENDNLPAESVEAAIDYQTMLVQRVADLIARSLRQPDGDSANIAVVPSKVDRLSKYLGFDAAGDPVAIAAEASAAIVSGFMATVLDDTTAAAARTTLDVPSTSEAILDTLVDAKGDLIVGTAADTVALLAIGAAGTIPMARAAATTGLVYVPALTKAIYGLTYTNNSGDAVNDIDIASGGCMDSTGAYWLTCPALTKRLDANWTVGNNNGFLSTGTIADVGYYLWAIARSDTGIVDYLADVSSTAPTMPASYDFKRLTGWIKRVGGSIVAFTTYETEGGGLELVWTTPTLDINQVNTLSTSRLTLPVKVPLTFSVVANINVIINDAASVHTTIIYCPDQADIVPSVTVAPLATVVTAAGASEPFNMKVRTNASGQIVARSTLATVDLYAVSTLGFTWARRN